MATLRGTFANSDLSNGLLTIQHNFGLTSPFQVIVAIFDSNNQLIPFTDNVMGYDNYATVDLTSLQAVNDSGTIQGTWGYLCVG